MKIKGIYLWAALPVAIAAVWFFAFYMPVSAEVRRSSQQLVELQRESERTDNEIASTNTLVQRDRKIERSVRDFASQVPQIAALPDFIRSVARRAKETGLSVTRINSTLPRPATAAGTALLHPVVEVDVRGRFLETGRFLDDLSQRVAFNGIMRARVSSTERENPVLTGQYVVELNVWREQQGAGK